MHTVVAARTEGLRGLALQAAFERGFYEHAFADHFLQDSYSAGHSGFARVASRPSIAGSFHDLYNDLGRVLMDGRGRRWFALGDGHLHDSRNEVSYQLLRAATRTSVKAFLLAFFTGQDSARDDLDTWERIPMEASEVHDSSSCAATMMSMMFVGLGRLYSQHCPDASLRLQPIRGIELPATPSWTVEFGLHSGIDRRLEEFGGATDIFFAQPAGMRVGGTIGMLGSRSDSKDWFARIGIVADVPLFQQFPLPISVDFTTRLEGLIGPHQDNELSGSWGGRAMAGLKVALDINKSRALTITGGYSVWRTSRSDEQNRFYDRGFLIGFGVNSVLAVSGGGAK